MGTFDPCQERRRVVVAFEIDFESLWINWLAAWTGRMCAVKVSLLWSWILSSSDSDFQLQKHLFPHIYLSLAPRYSSICSPCFNNSLKEVIQSQKGFESLSQWTFIYGRKILNKEHWVLFHFCQTPIAFTWNHFNGGVTTPLLNVFTSTAWCQKGQALSEIWPIWCRVDKILSDAR